MLLRERTTKKPFQDSLVTKEPKGHGTATSLAAVGLLASI